MKTGFTQSQISLRGPQYKRCFVKIYSLSSIISSSDLQHTCLLSPVCSAVTALPILCQSAEATLGCSSTTVTLRVRACLTLECVTCFRLISDMVYLHQPLPLPLALRTHMQSSVLFISHLSIGYRARMAEGRRQKRPK